MRRKINLSKDEIITISKQTINGKIGSLLDALIEKGYKGSFCSGRGTCGKCKVRFLENASIPTQNDRNFFSPDQLREGYRLACGVKLNRDCKIQIHFESQERYEILAEQTLVKSPNNRGIFEKEESYYVAVDIGTTTIVMQLVGSNLGVADETYRIFNSQRIYGTDVIARMQASLNGKREELKKLIEFELEKGIRKLTIKNHISPKGIFISGNTTMGHLLMGYKMDSLASFPFKPVNINEIEIVLAGIPAVIMPGISAFVGGDMVSGWMACGLHKTRNLHFLIDLGTNGEMMIGNKDRIMCTATAAGPAFEGGPTAHVPGTDMIDLVAQMLEAGIIDETGLLHDTYFDTGYRIQGVLITQKDIRDLQKAKAAVFAGMGILVEQYGTTWDMIQGVFLAGGFGFGLDVTKANRIGLFPDEIKDKVISVGNASLAGAIIYGREKQDLTEIIKTASEINLAAVESFTEAYISALNFPK